MDEDLDWNITANDTFEFITSSLISTLFNTEDDSSPDPKEPKAPPEAKSAQPPSHYEELGWKKALAIISLILLLLLLIFALLQIKFDKDCLPNFKKYQLKNKTARTLFILFCIGFICFIINDIVFISNVFNIHDLSETPYAYHLTFSMIPYRIGKHPFILHII